MCFLKKQKAFFLHYLLFGPQVSCVLFLVFRDKDVSHLSGNPQLSVLFKNG